MLRGYVIDFQCSNDLVITASCSIHGPAAAGEDARFFAFADTLAAKAFNSNRECEGVGSMALGRPSDGHCHRRAAIAVIGQAG